jgi:zinc protease
MRPGGTKAQSTPPERAQEIGVTRTIRGWGGTLGLVLTAAAWSAATAAALAADAPVAPANPASIAPPAVQRIPGKGSYAIVISEVTWADPQWKKVAEALRAKYDATVIVYPHSVDEARAALAAVFPRYACFVARPAEAGRDFVVAVHRMTRALDDDPYTDVIWGILTGYDAGDALRIAAHKPPLVVRKAAAGTGINLDAFDEGRWFSEGEQGAMWEKAAGGRAEKKQCPPDSTKMLVDTFNEFRPDLFLTSGHATEHDWQIGYSYKNGQFRCREGQLFGLDLDKKEHPINSPNPKVYLPAGNCLIGRIPGPDCMATAFMHTGGVYQMIGYTVSTWCGYGGWGVRDLFVGQPGRYTLAEAFYLNNQALVHQLQTRFPKSANVNFTRFDLEKDPHLLGKLAAEHGLLNDKRDGLRDRDELGLLWDRDTVAFYGDPAWEARLAPQPLAWEQKIAVAGGTYTFTLTANADGSASRPPMILLPHRVRPVQVTEGADLAPLITDNFLLLAKPAKFEKGKCYKVVFEAERIGPTRT